MKRKTLLVGGCVGWLFIAFVSLISSATAQSTAPSANPAGLPKELIVKLGDGLAMEFVLIPAGSFVMQAESDPVHEAPLPRKVTFARPFYMGRYVVTQEQWEKLMGNNPSDNQGPKKPVDNITWFDCQEFLAALKETAPGRQFNLPTEAQWEYACRAGSTNKYCYGDNEAELPNYAWYKANAGGTVHPVGQKKPNAWGLYDMHGNVWEWCQDFWNPDYTDAPTDGSAWTRGDDIYRVFRGGSYQYDAAYLRASRRSFIRPEKAGTAIGLRVVMAVETP